MKYRREIDGLRALAVLPVILFHAGFDTFSGGFVGVDIFFVISGYLITTVILSELEQGRFSIVNFYERRARRIYPALFVVILACFPFAWFWLLPSDMKDFAESLIAVTVFASNILFWRESGYFDTAAELKPLLHTWSLAVEEQFYVIFPLFLMILWKLGRRWILVFLLVISFSSLSLAQWASYAKPAAAFFLLPTRAWELLMGALAAFYLANPNRKVLDKNLSEVCGLIGISLIFSSIFLYDKNTPFPGLYALAPTVGTTLIIVFVTQNTIIGKLVGHKFLVGIGLVSYSAYLWHQPLFAFARHRSIEEPSQNLFLLLSVLALVFAYFSWRYIETPFRNKNNFCRKKIFTISFVFSSIFFALGFYAQKNNGLENRFEKVLSGDVGHIEFHQYTDSKYYDCEPDSVAENALHWEEFLRCKQSKQGTPDTILLGDSHAEHLFLGLAEHMPNNNISFYILGGNPYLDNPSFKTIFNEILSNKKRQNIILTMHFIDRLDGKSTGLYDGFSATIKALLDAGKSVVLVGDVPRFNQEPGYCVYATSMKFSSSCQLSIDEIKKQRSRYESILKQLSSVHDIRYLSIDGPLCSEDKCSMISGNAVVYRDNNHLNIIGSKIVGKHLAEKLASE